MAEALYRRLEAAAGWPLVALLVVASFVCSAGFAWRQTALFCAGETAGPEASAAAPEHDDPAIHCQTLDSRRWYTPAEAGDLFASLGADGRRLYAFSELSLDLVYPFVYGALLAVFLVRLFDERSARRLVLLPVVAAVVDLAENGSIAYLALSYDGSTSPLAWAAATFTAVKSVALLLSFSLVLVGGVRGLATRQAG